METKRTTGSKTPLTPNVPGRPDGAGFVRQTQPARWACLNAPPWRDGSGNIDIDHASVDYAPRPRLGYHSAPLLSFSHPIPSHASGIQ